MAKENPNSFKFKPPVMFPEAISSVFLAISDLLIFLIWAFAPATLTSLPASNVNQTISHSAASVI